MSWSYLDPVFLVLMYPKFPVKSHFGTNTGSLNLLLEVFSVYLMRKNVKTVTPTANKRPCKSLLFVYIVREFVFVNSTLPLHGEGTHENTCLISPDQPHMIGPV